MSPHRTRNCHPAATLALTLLTSAALVLQGAAAADSARAVSTAESEPAQDVTLVNTPESVLARLTLPQRVGQLFMVGSPAVQASSRAVHAIRDRHVGNVMLTGRSNAGVSATRKVSDQLSEQVSPESTSEVPLFVATDQEGGAVQVLRGPGFSRIPTALEQGSWSAAKMRARSQQWGDELRAAGVNVNLAPVVDTVPNAASARRNPPVGVFDRQYGYDTAVVSTSATAFVQGMTQAGVTTSPKHFPGLGRVTHNTDTTAGVTDHTTERNDPYLAPFASTIAAGAPFVMMSTAFYAKIDPKHPAAFSPMVVTTMLRGDLGFRGVVISDDLGNARQVQDWTPAARATSFLAAGGDLVLTVEPKVLAPMYDAVLRRARTDTTFRRQVDAAALRVLTAKDSTGVGLGPVSQVPPSQTPVVNQPTRLELLYRPRSSVWQSPVLEVPHFE